MSYIVITGASSGIGYEVALEFARQGKNLILAARRSKELESLKNQIKEINEKLDVIIRVVDLSLTEEVYKFYKSLKEYQIETFINNAGLGSFDTIANQNLSKIENLIYVNIEAITILSTLFVKDYQNIENTQIINISSGSGYATMPDAIVYSASKFYVSSFTEGLALELTRTGAKMKAKVLAPAVTETEFIKQANDVEEFDYRSNMKKFHTAKEMAKFLIKLYNSDKIVGRVDSNTYEFRLQDPILNHR